MIIVSTEALTLASKKGSETVSSPDQHNTRTSNSLWCPHSLSECRKITCKSLMLLSVTLVTVIAVWSTLCTLSTFYAIPKQGVNGSGKAGKTNETGTQYTGDRPV
jgi:hypothetical protein